MAADLGAIGLGLDQESVALAEAATGGLTRIVDAHNARTRLPGLDDALNPAVIDPAKAAALIAALPQQPAETLARMQGHELFLGGGNLGIRAADPTHADAFTRPFGFTIEDVQGKYVLAKADIPHDGALARQRATEAQAQLRAAEQAVDEAERAGTGGARLSEARRRRAALAVAWEINAQAWSQARSATGDAAASASLEAARKAAGAYMMPSGALP